MKKIQSQELIEKYLTGQLTEKEVMDFKNRLKSDSSFAQAFGEQQLLHEIIIDDALLHEKKRLQTFDFEKGAFKPKSSNTPLWFWGSVLVIGLGSIAGFLISTNGDETELDHRKTPPAVQLEVTKTGSTIDSLNEPDRNIEIPLNRPEHVEQTPVINASNHVDQYSETKNPLEKHTATQDSIPKRETNELHPIATTKSEAPQSNTKEEPASDPCEGVHLMAQLQTSAACIDETDGLITVAHASGGTKPYQYALHDGLLKRKRNTFNQLAEGYYTVYLYDAKGCSQVWENVFVEGKDCSSGKEEIFSLTNDGVWYYPIESDATCQITIRNKVGQVIYRELVQNGYPESWDGRNNLSDYVEPGNYPVTIEYPNDRVTMTAITVLP